MDITSNFGPGGPVGFGKLQIIPPKSPIILFFHSQILSPLFSNYSPLGTHCVQDPASIKLGAV